MKTNIVLVTSLATPVAVRADEEYASFATERIEAAQPSLFLLPGSLYEEPGRLLAAPTPTAVCAARNLLLRLPVLPTAVGDARFEPGRSAPPRRGES